MGPVDNEITLNIPSDTVLCLLWALTKQNETYQSEIMFIFSALFTVEFKQHIQHTPFTHMQTV